MSTKRSPDVAIGLDLKKKRIDEPEETDNKTQLELHGNVDLHTPVDPKEGKKKQKLDQIFPQGETYTYGEVTPCTPPLEFDNLRILMGLCLSRIPQLGEEVDFDKNLSKAPTDLDKLKEIFELVEKNGLKSFPPHRPPKNSSEAAISLRLGKRRVAAGDEGRRSPRQRRPGARRMPRGPGLPMPPPCAPPPPIFSPEPPAASRAATPVAGDTQSPDMWWIR